MKIKIAFKTSRECVCECLVNGWMVERERQILCVSEEMKKNTDENDNNNNKWIYLQCNDKQMMKRNETNVKSIFYKTEQIEKNG